MKLSIDKNKKKILVALLNILILASIFCGTFFILWSLAGSRSFGHDESVYLTKARSWIESTPADEFEIYRPNGMPALGWVFLHFSDSEKFVRLFGVIFGALTTSFVYLFFKRMFKVLIALTVVGIVVTSSLFLQEASLFQNDIPSSGLLIGTLWLLYIHYETAGKSKSVYLVGPLAAFAFYLRYGVASALGVIGVLSIFILGPRFLKKDNVNFTKLSYSLIISIILFAPHFIQSLIVEKSILGILSKSGAAAHRIYIGEGLINYIKWLPGELGGWILGITAIMGIVAVVIIISIKDLRQTHVSLLWIGSIGLLNFIVTGLLVHAEPRYVFFPMILLSGTGIAGAYYLIRNWSKIFANLLIVIFLLSIIYFGVNNYREANSFFETKEADPYASAYVRASEAIREDSTSKDGCAVWALTSNRPKISWYSRCNTLRIIDVDTFEKDFRTYIRKDHYSVVRSKLKEGQIDQDNAERFGVVLTEIFRTENLSKIYGGDLIVYRITQMHSSEENYIKLLDR